MRSRGLISASFVSILLVGCAAPLVSINPVTSQYKAEHVQDWKALAERGVAEFRKTQLTESPPIYVAPGPADMPFATTYKNYVEAALKRQGFEVVRSSSEGMALNFSVQTYLYGAEKRKYPFEYASAWSTIYAIGTQITNAGHDERGFMSAIGGPLVDVLGRLTSSTRGEVVLTLSVVDEHRTRFLHNEAFYVRPSDLPLYMTEAAPSAPQDTPIAPLNVVRIPVIAAGYH